MKQISFLRLLRFSITASIILTLIAFIFNIGIASANDVDTITIQGASVRADYTLDTARVISGDIHTNWNTFYYHSASTNHIVDFKVILQPTWSATNQTNSTAFTITSGGSGTGYLSYDNRFTNASEFALYYFFDNNALFTSSPVTLTLDKNILTNIQLVGTSYCSSGTLSSSSPVGLYSGGAGPCAGLPITSAVIYSMVNVGSLTNNTYNVTYFNNSQGFIIEVTKETIGTKVQLYDDFGNIYFTEPNFNTNTTNYLNNTNRGLTINITTADGAQAVQVINHSPTYVNVPTTPGSGGSASGQVYYDYTTTTIGSAYGTNASIDSANFSALNTYYIYAYDTFGNVVTGFPQSFNTQTYSDGRFWTFNTSGTYTANLSYCGFLNILCTSGLIAKTQLDSATIYIPPATYAYSITTDKLSYVPGETIIFTIDNPSPSKIYMDVFDPDINGFGVPDLGINVEIPPATSGYTISKTIPHNINKGNYTSYLISGLLTEESFNILDSYAFNISAPSSTSNSIFIGWDRNNYNLGDNGILTTVSDYNSTTVYVVSPSGVNKTYLFPSNSTNSTIISLNVVGSWKATLINATGYKLFANATVFAGSPIGNETFANCLFSETYICWDNTQYEQGDPYTISFKETIPFFAFPFKPYVQISNPSGTIIYNQSINGSYDPLEGIFIGTISGNFDPQASTGVYYARLINLNILGETEIKAEAAATVIPGVSVTTTEGQVSTTTATNLLNVLGMIAFYGLMIYVGLLYGLIRVMTRNGSPLNGSGFIYVAVILANIIALIGLFDPFKMYVLVLTWIIAGATFSVSRRAVSGAD